MRRLLVCCCPGQSEEAASPAVGSVAAKNAVLSHSHPSLSTLQSDLIACCAFGDGNDEKGEMKEWNRSKDKCYTVRIFSLVKGQLLNRQRRSQ